MKHQFGLLTSQQIRETYFIVPDLGVAMAYGDTYFYEFKKRRNSIRSTGGELNMIGWPDGSTIAYEHIAVTNNIDLSQLDDLYRLNAALHLHVEHQEKRS